MDDLTKSFKAVLYDRVTSPLLSSFLISWAVWNHRLFVVLMSSDLKIKEKFAYADNVLYPHWQEVLGRGFFFPLVSALILIFAYPLPARKVYEYVRKEQQRLKVIQQKIEDETPVTQEEARELRAALRKATVDFEKQLSDRDSQIQKLKADLNAIELSTAISQPAPNNFRDDSGLSAPSTDEHPLTESQLRILGSIAAADGEYDTFAFLRTARGPLRVHRKHDLDELLRLGFVTSRSDGDSELFEATPQGRAYVVKHPLPSESDPTTATSIPTTVIELNNSGNAG